jgi:hypothetical protein
VSEQLNEAIKRRGFIKKAGIALAATIATALGIGCTSEKPGVATTRDSAPRANLPTASPDPDSQFGVDLNINIENIDDYLNRDDVVYRDMRLYIDPADFGSIGGNPNIPDVLEGFKITPLPYIATLRPLPVEGRYEGPCLLAVVRDEEDNILEVKENYSESMMAINDLFPQDSPIFLTCGGSGYAAEMKELLVYLGWNEDLLYVIGPMWGYVGNRVIKLIKYPDNPSEDALYLLWRADYAVIDFELMHKLT